MSSLRLAICLGVVCRGEHSFGTHEVPQTTPKLTSKPWVPVMDNIVRNPKESHNRIKEQSCHSGSRQLPRAQNARSEAHELRQSVHTRENCIEAIPTRWQVSDKVHGPRFKTPGRDGQGCQQARGSLSAVLGTLTYLELPVHLLASFPHLGPPHSSSQ